jgi:hypothetical protein
VFGQRARSPILIVSRRLPLPRNARHPVAAREGNSSPYPTRRASLREFRGSLGDVGLEGEGDCAGLAESCQESLAQIHTRIEPAEPGRSQQRVEQRRNVGTPLRA